MSVTGIIEGVKDQSTSPSTDTPVTRAELDALVALLSSQSESLKKEGDLLRAENADLKKQLDWFKRQLFGPKSEKRLPHNPYQMSLGEEFKPPEGSADEQPKQTITYERGRAAKVRSEDCVTDAGLRFDHTVPVKTIRLPVFELNGLSIDQYEVIDINKTYRLAQRPASYVVLCYEQPVVKLKESQQIVSAIMTANALEKSVADVSFLVGLLVDKFAYHLPLYRQHQRLTAAGITLSRATLTNLVKRAIMLLGPIVDAQRDSVLQSRVLAIDETPGKVGKSKKRRGKMHQGYYWPMYGDKDEVVFTYSDSRARRVIEQLLNEQFTGTLISDGYSAYASYVAKTADLTHAQCWVHTRRYFFEARHDEPALVDEMLLRIGRLYKIEDEIVDSGLEGDAKREYRLTHSKPVVDGIVQWVQEQQQINTFLPSSPFTKALNYLHNRIIELRVFLTEPDVPLDTNHVERALRPIPMGRKNWLFCWTELGAEHVAIIQSLITTCKLHNIDPYVYLTDVLQRISVHPNNLIEQLTPRLWKHHFAHDPIQSDLMLHVYDGSE